MKLEYQNFIKILFMISDKINLGAGTGIRTQLEGSTVPQDNHYPIPARQNCSLLRGDKTFPAVGSPCDIHHQRDKILQAVDVVYLA